MDDTQEEDDEGFGLQYNFSLRDNADSSAVEAPEWLVPLGKSFQSLCQKNHLNVIKCQNFHDFIHERLQDDDSRYFSWLYEA